MARYVFTQFFFGGGAFNPAMMDALVDPVLARLGFTTQPATVVRTWNVTRPAFQPATADQSAYYVLAVPSSVFGAPMGVEFPNSTDSAEIDTITQVSKRFEGEIPARPWPDSFCTAAGFAAGSGPCRSGSAGSGMINVLSRAMNGGGDELAGPLVSRYGFFNRFRGGGTEALVVEASSGGGGMWVLLALAAGAIYMKSQGATGALSGLARRKRRKRVVRRSAFYRRISRSV